MALQLNVTQVVGDRITVAVFNPDDQPVTLRVRIRVTLQGWGEQTLTSGPLTVGPRELRSVTLTASGPIEIWDDPDPIF